MTLPPIGSTVYVVRQKAVVEALVKRYYGEQFKRFMWRAAGGGLGHCRLRDEGLTWTRALDSRELDAFRVAVAL